jgi:hypothetical protein
MATDPGQGNDAGNALARAPQPWEDLSEYVNVRAPRGACDGAGGGWQGLAGACVVLPTSFFYPLANTEAIDPHDYAAVCNICQRLSRQTGGGARAADAVGGQEEAAAERVAAAMETMRGAGFESARALGIYAVHLWARSWCAPGVSSAGDGHGLERKEGRGGGGASAQKERGAAGGGGTASGSDGTSGGARAGGSQFSNQDMLWLANLALRNKK